MRSRASSSCARPHPPRDSQHGEPGAASADLHLEHLLGEHVVASGTMDALRRGATTRVGRAGDVLVQQGDPLPLVIAVEGLIAVRRTSADDHEFTLYLMAPGQVMGIGSARRRGTSMFDFVALTEARVTLLSGASARRLAMDDPALALALFDVAAGTVTLLSQRLDQSTFDSAQTRLATVLLAYEPLFAQPASPISRDELAGLAGVSREMLRHVLRDLEARDIVHRRGRSIVVGDRPALREVAHWAAGGAGHARTLQSGRR